jgi:hypothetical protein
MHLEQDAPVLLALLDNVDTCLNKRALHKKALASAKAAKT